LAVLHTLLDLGQVGTLVVVFLVVVLVAFLVAFLVVVHLVAVIAS